MNISHQIQFISPWGPAHPSARSCSQLSSTSALRMKAGPRGPHPPSPQNGVGNYWVEKSTEMGDKHASYPTTIEIKLLSVRVVVFDRPSSLVGLCGLNCRGSRQGCSERCTPCRVWWGWFHLFDKMVACWKVLVIQSYNLLDNIFGTAPKVANLTVPGNEPSFISHMNFMVYSHMSPTIWT